MALTPFARLFLRLTEIHTWDELGNCVKCHEPLPCDTMRSLWIYDLEERPGVHR